MYTKNKTEVLRARLSPQEKEMVRKASVKQGIKMSEFLREAVVEKAKQVLK